MLILCSSIHRLMDSNSVNNHVPAGIGQWPSDCVHSKLTIPDNPATQGRGQESNPQNSLNE